MDLGLQGKVALVAAASQGMGRAVALNLAREGCQVGICARNAGPLKEAARSIHEETGAEVLTVSADVSRAGDAGAFVDKARAAKDSGKALFLLPRANARLVQYTQRTREYYGFTFVQQVPATVDAKTYIEDNVGVPVRYVDTISDVLAATAPG